MKICHHFFHKPFKTYFCSVYNFCLTFFPLSTSVELCFDLNEKCPKQEHVCGNLVSIPCRGGYGSFRRRVLAVRIISMMGELESSAILKLPDYSVSYMWLRGNISATLVRNCYQSPTSSSHLMSCLPLSYGLML